MGESGLGKGVVGGAEVSDEDLDLGHFACVGVCQRQGEAGIVDEEFVARLVNLEHGRGNPLFEGGVDFAVAGVAEAVGVSALILFPQKL